MSPGEIRNRPDTESRAAADGFGDLTPTVARAAGPEPKRIAHYPRRDGRLPAGARWVGRPSRWGNPFPVGRPCPRCQAIHTADEAVELFRKEVLPGLDLDPLRSATALACACPIGDPCHADVLISRLSARPLGVIW